MTGEKHAPDEKYQCIVCGKTSHKPKPIVMCEWQHTKEQTRDKLKELLRL